LKNGKSLEVPALHGLTRTKTRTRKDGKKNGSKDPPLHAPVHGAGTRTTTETEGKSGAEVEEGAVEDHAEAGEEEERSEDLVDKRWNGNGNRHAAVAGGEEINDAGEKSIEKTAAHVFAAFEGVYAVDALHGGIGGGNGFAAIGATRQRYANRFSTKWTTTRRKQMSLAGV